MTKTSQRIAVALAGALLVSSAAAAEEYLGRLRGSPNAADSTANRSGVYGSHFNVQSPSNPYTVTPPIVLGD
jgi:hypothetical protein